MRAWRSALSPPPVVEELGARCTRPQAPAQQQERKMTIDKSLKISTAGSGSRSVLTRAERLTKLKEADRWTEEQSPLGLPKVRVVKLSMKKKKKKKKEDEDDAAPAADKKK
jgi:small basic protein (TIGR04137 family)